MTGLGIDAGLAFDTTGNACVYSNICYTVGPGVAAGLGFPTSSGSGALSSGIAKSDGLFWSGGDGWLGEGQILHAQDGSGGSAGGSFGGVGGGEATGYVGCRQMLMCVKN